MREKKTYLVWGPKIHRPSQAFFCHGGVVDYGMMRKMAIWNFGACEGVPRLGKQLEGGRVTNWPWQWHGPW